MRTTPVALAIAVLTVSGCLLLPTGSQRQWVGIWVGAHEGTPMSIELRADGRAILVHGGEDEVALGAYALDTQQAPAHLDIRFDKKDWGVFRTIVQRTGSDSIRVEGLKEDAPRPREFTADAVVLRRSNRHVLPRGIQSAQGLADALAAALKGDIWFDGGRGQDMLAICEALFRYQLANNHSGQQQKAPAYFLTVAGRDPPKALLERFTPNGPPVRPGSEFREGAGVELKIDRLVWINRRTVEAEGGHYAWGLSSSTVTYLLRRTKSGWTVVLDRLNTG